jgi:hypothetical protein
MYKDCWLILGLFNYAVSNAEIIYYQMKLENDREWWIGKYLEEGTYDLFEGTVLALTLTDRKSQKVSASTQYRQ